MMNSRDLSRYICSCRSGKVQVQLHVQAFAGADVMSLSIKYAFNESFIDQGVKNLIKVAQYQY